ncbi:MAG: TetR/AcrR family transcriptional regulator [Chitinophagales bacterium]|nr:TetR/AcrR family transcriptional regulator [Chitinophagales bacterium]HAE12722.1 hypothetical protein [Bacteroidota bacterium]MCB9019774.1 TetR/AcrR family transcriptional regulator [Chitinophagales bacterium]MCB9021451.1 TetR/AcrR family transcriptional regulator [Chitinophagales bacterium]MCB9032032.1 TetR/AcrR family transcriptional regulator [Chitinophagales bacterium]
MSPRTAIQNEQIREKSREKIVLAAMELFSKQSFHRTSVADIARTAGISKGLIYNYFETKEDILRGIIDYMFAIGDQIMEESRAEGDPRKELRHMIEQMFAFLQQQAHISRMLIPLALEMGQFTFINEIIERKAEHYLGRLVRILEELGYEDPEMEAWMLGILFDGIPLDYMMLGERMPIKRIEQYIYKKYNL